jgi:hypothetical protein
VISPRDPGCGSGTIDSNEVCGVRVRRPGLP